MNSDCKLLVVTLDMMNLDVALIVMARDETASGFSHNTDQTLKRKLHVCSLLCKDLK